MTAAPATRILGTGRFLPPDVRTNFDLEKMVDTTDEWIVERTGIRERRIAPEGMVTSDMASAAAREALAAAELSATDLDMIIVATVTPDMPMPATAVTVQQKIGARNCPAFDLSAACAGFVFGMAIADQFIRSGSMRHILVVGVELLSRVVDWEDRSTCILFGDGAGATVFGPASGATAKNKNRGIHAVRFATDGSYLPSLLIPGGGSIAPQSHDVVEKRLGKVHMKGQDLFKVAVKNLHAASKEALEAAGATTADIDWVVPHQANLRIIDQVTSRLGTPPEKVLSNIERVGNTSSASIPILLDENVRAGKIQPGDTVLMSALGAGVSWGGAVVTM